VEHKLLEKMIDSKVIKYKIFQLECELVINNVICLHTFRKITKQGLRTVNVYDRINNIFYTIEENRIVTKLEYLEGAFKWPKDTQKEIIDQYKIEDLVFLGFKAERWYCKYRKLDFDILREEEKIYIDAKAIYPKSDINFLKKFAIYSDEKADNSQLLVERKVKFPSNRWVEDITVHSIEFKEVDFSEIKRIIETG